MPSLSGLGWQCVSHTLDLMAITGALHDSFFHDLGWRWYQAQETICSTLCMKCESKLLKVKPVSFVGGVSYLEVI